VADGALKADVLRALRGGNVTVEDHSDPNYYRLTYAETVLVVRLTDVVSRTQVHRLGRAFGIQTGKFFPPLRAVAPVAIEDLPSAAGLAE
jgi:hypothetical protein